LPDFIHIFYLTFPLCQQARAACDPLQREKEKEYIAKSERERERDGKRRLNAALTAAH